MYKHARFEPLGCTSWTVLAWPEGARRADGHYDGQSAPPLDRRLPAVEWVPGIAAAIAIWTRGAAAQWSRPPPAWPRPTGPAQRTSSGARPHRRTTRQLARKRTTDCASKMCPTNSGGTAERCAHLAHCGRRVAPPAEGRALLRGQRRLQPGLARHIRATVPESGPAAAL